MFFALCLKYYLVLLTKYPCLFTKCVVLWRHDLATVKPVTIERFRVAFTENSKREFVPRDQVFSLNFFDCFTLVLSIRTVLDCFHLLIFYSENLSTEIWSTDAVYTVSVTLNLSTDWFSHDLKNWILIASKKTELEKRSEILRAFIFLFINVPINDVLILKASIKIQNLPSDKNSLVFKKWRYT